MLEWSQNKRKFKPQTRENPKNIKLEIMVTQLLAVVFWPVGRSVCLNLGKCIKMLLYDSPPKFYSKFLVKDYSKIKLSTILVKNYNPKF